MGVGRGASGRLICKDVSCYVNGHISVYKNDEKFPFVRLIVQWLSIFCFGLATFW